MTMESHQVQTPAQVRFGAGLRWLIRLILGAATIALVFRTEISNGFSVLLGDPLDGMIQTSIMQHWSNVIHGVERWDTTAYFYPNADTLGYNDGYFVNGVLLFAFRLSGIDPFLASELASLAIKAIGFYAFELFAADIVLLGFGWLLLGALIFTLSSSVFNQSGHVQLLTVSFAPLLCWLLGRGLQLLRTQSGVAAIGWGCAAAILYGAWLMTAFYIAWFTLLFLTLMIVAALAQELAGRGAGFAAWRAVVTWKLAPVLLCAFTACLPFLMVYLPKAAETGSHAFHEALVYTPTILDLLHVGSENILFGGLDRFLSQFRPPSSGDYSELTVGFPPAIAILAVAGIVVALRTRSTPMMIRSIALATLASCVMFVRVGDHTLWYLIFSYFPGGNAVRVVARYAIVLTFPVTLLAISVLRAQAGRWPLWLVVSVAALLVAEELSTFRPMTLDRRNEVALLNAIPPPPADCRVFFVSNSSRRPSSGDPFIDSLYGHNVEAMMLAETIPLPTINGFSTFNPPGWNLAANPLSTYLDRVRNDLLVHGVQDGICGLDLSLHQWGPPPDLVLPPLASGTRLTLGTDGDEAGRYLVSGWDQPVDGPPWGNGRWVNQREARLWFAMPGLSAGDDVRFSLSATSFVRAGRTPTAVAVTVNETQIALWQPQQGDQVLTALIPQSLVRGRKGIDVYLAAATAPTSWLFRQPRRERRIGLFAKWFQIDAVPPPNQ